MTLAQPERPLIAQSGGNASPLRFVMPSVADLFFVSIVAVLTLGAWASRLLWDTSTGWHIRNGERILRTLSIPHSDPFSYTMAGQPWYAWEWLWDAINGGLHIALGLSGVVALAALVIAVTFALLYRSAARRGENVLIAAALTVLALGASSIHFLARPHVAGWLFVVLFLRELENLGEGSRRPLWSLPLLTVLWTNLHGSFVLGLALIALFLVAEALERGAQVTRFAQALGLGAAATLVNPYGLKLHEHVLRYLASGTQMNRVDEFLSPNFHQLQPRLFLVLVLITATALCLGRRPRWRETLLAAFAVALGLSAARNIPLAVIMIVWAVAPSLSDPTLSNTGKGWGSRTVAALRLRGMKMWKLERDLKGHLLPVLAVIGLGALLLAGFRLPNAHWDPKRVPAKALAVMTEQLQIRDHFFSPDYWGGYIIYEHANDDVRVAVDDRSDLYGDARFRQYVELADASPGWRKVADDWQLTAALVPADSSLRSLLAAAPDWQQAYADDVAVVFVRRSPSAGDER